jgi:hypothetical protein
MVARISAFSRVHDLKRTELTKAGLTNVYSSQDKRHIIVVLKDRVKPGSEKRKICPQVRGAAIHVQANECGPFDKISGSYAQVVCDIDGHPLKPVLDFAKLKGGFVAHGGHRAIFDAPSLVVLKGYQDQQKVSISNLTPFVLGDEAWISDDVIVMVDAGDELPEQFSKYNDAYLALLTRLRAVATTELHYAL